MKPLERRICRNCGPSDFQLQSRGYWACLACLKAAKRKYARSERAKLMRRLSYLENREKILLEQKKEREESPEVVRERRAMHYSRRKDHIKKRVKTYKDAAKLEAMSHYSGGPPECRRCGINDLTKLALDHVNDDGRDHRKGLGEGGNLIYLWVRKNGYPPIFQVLCHNCNIKKQASTLKKKPSPSRVRLKIEVLTRYSDGVVMRCRNCHETDVAVLTIDHVAGGGNEHRRSLKTKPGYRFYLWLKREGFPDGFQTLCFNCNLSRHIGRM